MILVLGIVGIYKYFKMSGNYFAALKAKNEELSGFIAEKDKFFSIIAHDLRSPITSFMGLTGLMAEDAKTLPPERLEKMARLLNNSATSLYGLLDNLLDWASMQRGMFSYNPVTFNLATQVMECLQLTRDSAHSKNIEMEITIPDYLEVFADKRMFETVLRNLVLNAVKFTQKGGNVDVSARKREGDLIEIRVRDTGIGMKKELVDQLFKISGQTGRPGTDGEPSTGLGLIICKDFVEQHNGQIWVESEEGKGSTFIFTIPKDSAV
jgi:signal transduction histidine kinase